MCVDGGRREQSTCIWARRYTEHTITTWETNILRHMKIADRKIKQRVALRIVLLKTLSSQTMNCERNYFVKQFLLYLSLL